MESAPVVGSDSERAAVGRLLEPGPERLAALVVDEGTESLRIDCENAIT